MDRGHDEAESEGRLLSDERVDTPLLHLQREQVDFVVSGDERVGGLDVSSSIADVTSPTRSATSSIISRRLIGSAPIAHQAAI